LFLDFFLTGVRNAFRYKFAVKRFKVNDDLVRKRMKTRLLKASLIVRFLPGRVVVLLTGLLMLGACATSPVVDTRLPPLQGSARIEQVADVDLLAVTPEMEAFLERYILPYDDPHTRLNMLTLAITSSGVLGFDYDDTRTLTAAEAFKTRTGNCISFANMMVALARKAGLDASYQEVLIQPVWTSREDTLLITKHINVVVSSPRYSYVVDVSGVRISEHDRRRIIADLDAKTLFYSNIGAEALIANELPTAWAYLSRAINLESRLTDPWVNLGVVYSRNDQLDAAELAYQTALQIDSSDSSAMSNLYEVYLVQENMNAAADLEKKVERYREKNPYYLMMLSEESLEMGHYEDSIRLLQRALRKKDDDYMLHFAMAKTQYLSGETVAAQSSLHRVRELAPQELLAYYSRPLHELVMEDQEKKNAEIPQR
jgi:Flp pilus assembly protein TadD